MLTSSVQTPSKVTREESVLRELTRFSYCPRCHKPCCSLCPACGDQAFQAVVYFHNVPKVNGLPEQDDECAACQLMKQPQKAFSELHMCERELDSVFAGAKTQQELIDQIDYFVDMSADAIFVQCPACCQVVPRSSSHLC